MEKQARDLGVEILTDEIIRMDFEKDKKRITTRSRGNVGESQDKKSQLESRAVIIATGGEHRKLGITGENEFTGKGVSYCVTCDAPFFRDRIVAVVGGGNIAVEDALHISELTKKTYLIHKEEVLRAEEARQKDLVESGVELILNSTVDEIIGDMMVKCIRIKDTETNLEIREIDVDGVFISIGTVPSLKIAQSAGIGINKKGYIKTNGNQETNIKGVFAAGDVTGGVMQVATAVGEGCIAALSAYRHIKSTQ